MADVIRMISFSHWGMFEVLLPYSLLPAGWAFKDLKSAVTECHRPDGFIEIVRI